MSLDYQKLKVKKFPKKTYKQSAESRYWKKFTNVLLERDPSQMQIGDLTFCRNTGVQESSLLAVAISARVDLYKLTQPEGDDLEDGIKPFS